jgi:hypothetical protein
MKNTFFALIMLIFLNPISGITQNFKNIGSTQSSIELDMKNLKEFYDKENRKKLKNKFEYSIETDSTSSSTNKNKKFIKSDYVWYTTPFRSYTDIYYFNDLGICDSMVVFENVCLDCGISEDSSNMVFLQYKWNKVSANEFISNAKHYLSGNFKKNNLKSAYIKLTRDPLPANGVCRKWTFVLDEVKNHEKKEKFFDDIYFDSDLYWRAFKNTLLILGAITLIGLVL